MKLAVIETGGKQYKIFEGQKIKVERLKKEVGDKIFFDKVLLFSDGKEVKIGTPYLDKVQVEGRILKQGRDEKKIVFKYHSKTRYRKKKGHRQLFTEVEIVKI